KLNAKKRLLKDAKTQTEVAGHPQATQTEVAGHTQATQTEVAHEPQATQTGVAHEAAFTIVLEGPGPGATDAHSEFSHTEPFGDAKDYVLQSFHGVAGLIGVSSVAAMRRGLDYIPGCRDEASAVHQYHCSSMSVIVDDEEMLRMNDGSAWRKFCTLTDKLEEMVGAEGRLLNPALLLYIARVGGSGALEDFLRVVGDFNSVSVQLESSERESEYLKADCEADRVLAVLMDTNRDGKRFEADLRDRFADAWGVGGAVASTETCVSMTVRKDPATKGINERRKVLEFEGTVAEAIRASQRFVGASVDTSTLNQTNEGVSDVEIMFNHVINFAQEWPTVEVHFTVLDV
ncbi:Hypothetical Protein FCC1311_060072, partial [Hondaea fermentalgiana]